MSETMDMFKGALQDLADSPLSKRHATGFQILTEGLLRRLSEKGLTLEECAGRKMLNRPVATLKGHCTRFGIRFPDFTPANMRKHIQFMPSGDYLELTGEFVAEVASVLGLVVTKRDGVATCGLQRHAFPDAKNALRSAGFEAKKGKAPKKQKGQANG
ncbi:hypothetical protein [Devosia sp.]|uniref:hypothetical protein n=1 Tax=Devosia sp. TaxID=1871048 RepID=UPI001AC22C88|nr:hypothetical protein [Devosia sp.]MBN9335071.1 hypothetical protein [Devosia sp.]